MRVRGIEPRFQAWEAHVIAVILHPLEEEVRSKPGSTAVKHSRTRPGFATEVQLKLRRLSRALLSVTESA